MMSLINVFAENGVNEKEFKDFEEEPIVREYLAAELEICRRIQEINASITDVVDIDMDIA